ncbi:MAG: uL15 family ribosomal protein [Nanoarchaeota archaeon]|nr:uL15 family ribosomal protein [Nanoarchaeota archaeon]
MTTHKKKKVTKYRGSKSHGGGAKKKRRGAGSRGGRGRAGSGKRGDAKKPSIWSDPLYFGKHGFRMKGHTEKIIPINVGYISDKIESMKMKGIASEKGGVYEIDLEKAGYNKLLGSGTVTKKLKITVKYAVQKAVDKIKKTGGEVILIKKEEKKVTSETKELKTSKKNKDKEGKEDSKEE